MHDFSKSEMGVSDTVIKEVINTRSHYFGDLIVVTHKAYALDRAWYKGRLSTGDCIWFDSVELEDVT